MENRQCENASKRIILNHRGTEDTEKNREGILQHDKDCVMRVGEHINRIPRISHDSRNERCRQLPVFAYGEYRKLVLSMPALDAGFEFTF